jgi:hypothetical protein
MNTETGEIQQRIPHHASTAESISLSPNREQLLVLHSHSLNLLSVKDELKVKTLVREHGTFSDAEWTPSGCHILVSDHQGKVRIIDPKNATVTDFLTLAPGQAAAIAVKSDARSLAVGSGQFVDMSLRPPRQKTGENVVRLFTLPPDLGQEAPATSPPGIAPGSSKPSVRLALALSGLRESYSKEYWATAALPEALIGARNAYLETLRTIQSVAFKEQKLDVVLAIHEEISMVDLGLPIEGGNASTIFTAHPKRLAYAKYKLAWQMEQSEKRESLRRKLVFALKKLAAEHPGEEVCIQAELEKLSAQPNIP